MDEELVYLTDQRCRGLKAGIYHNGRIIKGSKGIYGNGACSFEKGAIITRYGYPRGLAGAIAYLRTR